MPSERPLHPDPYSWLTRNQAAEYTGLSKNTIRRAAQRGDLQEGGTEGKRLYQRLWLDAWLSKRAAELAILLVTLAIVGAACGSSEAIHDALRELHLPCLFAPEK